MDLLNLVNAIIVMVGIPAIVAASIYTGRKLQVLDNLVYVVNNQVLPRLDDIERRLIEIEKKMTLMESKLDILWGWFSQNVLPAARLDIAPNE
jgi:hypothetical protein